MGTNNPGNLDNLDFRGIVRWKPTNNIDVRLRYDHQRDYTNGPADINEATPTTPFNPLNNVANIPSPRDVAYDTNGYTHFNSDRVTLNVDWRINDDIELKDVTGYQHYTSRDYFEGDNGSPFTTKYGSLGTPSAPTVNCSASSFPNCQTTDVLSSNDTYWYQEFDLLSTNASPLQWTLGADYYYDNTPIHNEFVSYNQLIGDARPTDPAACPTAPFSTPPGETGNSGFFGTGYCPGLGILNYYQYDYSYAGFGEIKYNFSDQLQLIVGGRWTYYKIVLQPTTNITDDAGNVVGRIPGAPPFVGYCGSVAPGGTPPLCQGVNASAPYSKPSGRAVLNWFPNPQTTVYGSVSYGFKQGSYVTQLDEGQGEHPGYKAETITDYELGLKTTTFDGHLRFDGDVYYENYDNYQAAFFLSSAPIPLTKTIDAAEVYGFEGNVDFVWDDLKLSAVVGYNGTRITRNSDLSLVRPASTGPANMIPAADHAAPCTIVLKEARRARMRELRRQAAELRPALDRQLYGPV